jgi:hypothetical protein
MNLRPLALAALAGAAILSAATANAQYYEPYGRPPPGYGYDRPPPPYGYERPRYGYGGGRRIGDMCVTSRGSCETRPSPRGAPCRCYFDGFGEKRGNID